MDKHLQVVIYGNSIFMAGIETILRGQPGIDVTRLAPDLSGLRNKQAVVTTDDPAQVVLARTEEVCMR